MINRSYLDTQSGKITDKDKRIYEEVLQKGDVGWGKNGRITAYARCGVGLVHKVEYAEKKYR